MYVIFYLGLLSYLYNCIIEVRREMERLIDFIRVYSEKEVKLKIKFGEFKFSFLVKVRILNYIYFFIRIEKE